ncbi:TPA: hypothetical protein N0F65_010572 [Lagenidium giganteum]|uniref:Uncharacterized protein n=1 Tax=Lagenidium giganteum TaxID=4803 RepID=A0AAV2ZFB4_9STRA|nr:TPA: hypothetical protein N0F65_010572 [Lagenidium giganteum]
MKATTKTTASDECRRMQRMRMILQKAMDVSVRHASAASLKDLFAAECADEPELLQQLFPSENAASEDELCAQVLQRLRHKIEHAFEEVVARDNVDQKLRTLESILEEAEAIKLQQKADEEKNEATDVEEPTPLKGSTAAVSTPGVSTPDVTNRTTASPARTSAANWTPEELVLRQRQRVMEDEKRELTQLVASLRSENEALQSALDMKRDQVKQHLEQLQRLATHLDDAVQYARDYAERTPVP